MAESATQRAHAADPWTEHLEHFAQWSTASSSSSAPPSNGVGVFGDAVDFFGLHGLDPVAREQGAKMLLQKFHVLLEYERAREVLPSGMYLTLDCESLLVWHGTLFVRRGLYCGGVFKFRVKLPENYPDAPPEIHVVSDLFHPLVDADTGQFDVAAFCPEWRSDRDCASAILPHVHRALLRRDHLAGSGARPPLNPGARHLLLTDPAAFAQRAGESARKSLLDACANSPLAAQLRDEQVGEPADSEGCASDAGDPHACIFDQFRIVAKDEHRPFDEQVTAFADWFCDRYSSTNAAPDERSCVDG